MKIPLKWLADYVPTQLTVGELARRLTMAGLEVTAFRSFGLPVPEDLRIKQEEAGPVWESDKVVIGRILGVDQHPNANKLKLVNLDYGASSPKVVVTGAPNIAVGDKGQTVIIGLTGTRYWDTHVTPPDIKELKPTTLRGVPSDSMVMSEAELGISEGHEGIILLDEEVPVGTSLADYMGDIVLEVDVLPNMARCLSLIGVAREVAAITGTSMKRPGCSPKAEAGPIEARVKVQIDNPELSARYAAGLIEGVTIGPAPGWMQRRLTYAGMRPISNIVDITNYVMLEWGQPLHAFDYDVLVARAGGKAPTIIVRAAKEDEVLKTLDGVERKLTPDMLVIADEKGAIALAGVMGGAETEVSDTTKNILLESASFDFVSIRRTSRALDLPSEASMRFSRGVHPEMVPIALGRASELMRQYATGKVCQGIVDNYPRKMPPHVVEVPMSEIRRLLGVEIPLKECTQILKTLEYGVEEIGNASLRVTVPPHRLDIQEGAADVIEDLVRLWGYDKLPATMLSEPLPEQVGNDEVVFEERVRDELVALGLQEAITYAMTTPEREASLSMGEGEYVRILNPISSERVVMRKSILPGILEVLKRNLEHVNDVRIFEIGNVYLPHNSENLPYESRRLGIVLCGRRYQDHWGDGGSTPKGNLDFYDLKGIVEGLLKSLHLSRYRLVSTKVPMLHPGKGAEILGGSRGCSQLGVFGELHPRIAQREGFGGKTVLVADLDLNLVRHDVPARYAYQPISRFPVALRDVAIIVDESITAEQAEAEIRSAGGVLLKEIRLFDVYRGESIPAGTKSLAYALSYQAADRTLQDKDVEKAHKAIETHLRQALKAQIRGQD